MDSTSADKLRRRGQTAMGLSGAVRATTAFLKKKTKQPAPHRRSALYRTLRGTGSSALSQLYHRFIGLLICLNVAMFVMSTDPTLWKEHQNGFFYYFEALSAVVFSLEYMLRLLTIHESTAARKQGLPRLQTMMSWVASSESIIDLLSFGPFFLEPIINSALPSLGVLRVLRLVRLMKANKVMKAFRTVQRVLYYNGQILGVTCTLCGFLVLITATMLYYVQDNTSADFESIPATTYLAIMMLTGQGGPEGPMPWYTKFMCAATSFLSVALFCLPSSMLTWAFEAEAERLMTKEAARRKEAANRPPEEEHAHGSDSSDTSDDDEIDEWAEYEQTIIGDEDDDAAGDGVGNDKLELMEQRLDSMEKLLHTIATQVSEIHAKRT